MFKGLKDFLLYRELTRNLVIRDLKIKYKGSAIGFLWSLLNPLLMLIVYTFAFDYVLRIREIGGVTNFPLFFMCAFLPWAFFSQSLSMSVSSLVDNANLIKKIYFPREILPISIVLSNLVNFLLTFFILFPALFFWKVQLSWVLVLLPATILLHTLFTIGLSLMLASLYVFFRDIKHLLEVFLTIWFWLTPIVYPMRLVEQLPPFFERLYLLNPMTVFTEIYRDLLLYGQMPNIQAMTKVVLFTIFSLSFGILVFSTHSPRLAENV